MEHIVWAKIFERLPWPLIRDDKLIGDERCALARTRPDACWLLEDRVLHLEVDEHSHDDREIACELKKLDSANWGIADGKFAHLPTWTVRFNPSEYDRRRVTLTERCDALVEHLLDLLRAPLDGWCTLRTNVTFMYYHSKAGRHIEAARAATESVVVQRIVE